MTLEEYLAGEYFEDRQDVTAIEGYLRDTAATFTHAFDQVSGWWPYGIDAGGSVGPAAKSHGTSAMILSALAKIARRSTMRDGQNCEPIPGLPAGIDDVLKRASEVLCSSLKKDKRTKSGTFGDNDVLTISHVSELIRGSAEDTEIKIHCAPLWKSLKTASQKINKICEQNPLDWKEIDKEIKTGKEATNKRFYVQSSFLMLRIIRALADIEGQATVSNDGFEKYFEATLHEQLSYSDIPDSRFDPAEVAFCLEGLLICAPDRVDARLFDRVLRVLADKQESSAHWRPAKPFMASPTGAVMLPLSVESANSLLRAIEIVDGNRLHDTFASRAVPLVRRFWHWLRTRHIKIMAAGKEFSGWHSEHMDAEGAVHLWDTSQVAEFMLGYRKLLNRHIASTTLVLSRLESPVDPHDRSLNWRAEWEEKVREFEPLKGIAREDQVYRRTFTDFVEPWGIGEPTNYSMLLYGPPGTGKSTFAKNIAKVLGLRMITVTVSDFLGRGSENVEARVKAIFQTLEAQSDAVILFDEIDTFLLDRDSALYREQDTLFQFLTPGMLTKIADLRNKRRSIFIIATNYANRIDPAIKRTGRIDKRYLLSLPDRQQRIDIVKDLVGRDLGNREEVAAASLFFGYSDIRGAVEDAGGTKASDAEILGRLREREPSTSLLSYARRIDEENYPSEELAELAGMANEVRRSDVIDAAIRAVPLLRRHSFKRYLH